MSSEAGKGQEVSAQAKSTRRNAPTLSSVSNNSRQNLAQKHRSYSEERDVAMFIDTHALERLCYWAQEGGTGDIQELYQGFLDDGCRASITHFLSLTAVEAREIHTKLL